MAIFQLYSGFEVQWTGNARKERNHMILSL